MSPRLFLQWIIVRNICCVQCALIAKNRHGKLGLPFKCNCRGTGNTYFSSTSYTPMDWLITLPDVSREGLQFYSWTFFFLSFFFTARPQCSQCRAQ